MRSWVGNGVICTCLRVRRRQKNSKAANNKTSSPPPRTAPRITGSFDLGDETFDDCDTGSDVLEITIMEVEAILSVSVVISS